MRQNSDVTDRDKRCYGVSYTTQRAECAECVSLQPTVCKLNDDDALNLRNCQLIVPRLTRTTMCCQLSHARIREWKVSWRRATPKLSSDGELGKTHSIRAITPASAMLEMTKYDHFDATASGGMTACRGTILASSVKFYGHHKRVSEADKKRDCWQHQAVWHRGGEHIVIVIYHHHYRHSWSHEPGCNM